MWITIAGFGPFQWRRTPHRVAHHHHVHLHHCGFRLVQRGQDQEAPPVLRALAGVSAYACLRSVFLVSGDLQRSRSVHREVYVVVGMRTARTKTPDTHSTPAVPGAEDRRRSS